MSGKKSLILNFSGKKIATSFVHDLFRKHFTQNASKQLFVPAFKEWFFIPEKSPNYENNPAYFIDYINNKYEDINKDDCLFLLLLFSFETTEFSKKYFRWQDIKPESEKQKKMVEIIRLLFKRFYYIHKFAMEKYSSILLSDPSLQKHLLIAPKQSQKLIFRTFYTIFDSIKLFGLIRPPIDAIISLIKTQPSGFFSIIKQSESARDDVVQNLVSRYNQFTQLRNFIKNCAELHPKILLIDFNHFVKNTSTVFPELCDFLSLDLEGPFINITNPNPSNEMPEEYNEQMEQIVPIIDAEIRKQINLKEYERMSEKKIDFLE